MPEINKIYLFIIILLIRKKNSQKKYSFTVWTQKEISTANFLFLGPKEQKVQLVFSVYTQDLIVILGHTAANIHVIEFHKRGLLSMHILLFLAEEDKIKDPDTIDRVVCTEIPDATSERHPCDILAATIMIHGLCSMLNPHS